MRDQGVLSFTLAAEAVPAAAATAAAVVSMMRSSMTRLEGFPPAAEIRGPPFYTPTEGSSDIVFPPNRL